MKITRVRALLASLAVAGAVSMPLAGRDAAVATCDSPPRPVAHRGGTELRTENTLAAFRSAGEAGITEWELDIRFDINDTPVVLHDSTVDRISPATGAIKTLDATGNRIPTNDGQYIPTYLEVLQLAGTFNAYVLSELKTIPTDAQWEAVLTAVDSTVGRENVTLMSFNGETVVQAHERAPGTRTGLVHEAGYLSVEQIRRYGDSLIKAQAAYSRYRAEEWQAGGIRLYAWTVNQADGWRRLDALPIDAVITDRPIAYQDWIKEGCPQ